VVIGAKTAAPIEMQFGLWARKEDPRNCARWGSRSSMGRDNFGERGAYCKV